MSEGRFAAMRVSEILDALASNAPAPGGGTASAMAGAAGFALLEMACAIASKKAQGADADRLAKLGAAAKAGRDELLSAMTRDSDAYDGIRAASKTIKEQGLAGAEAARLRAEATRQAASVPLSVSRRCAEGLELARTVLRVTKPATRTDVGVAVALFRGAALGAAYNVQVNLDETLPRGERLTLARGAAGSESRAEHHARALARRVERAVGFRRA